MVSEFLAFVALVCRARGEVFCCLSLLSKDDKAVLEVGLCLVLVFECDDAGGVFFVDSLVRVGEVSWIAG